jgi:hypothetical protein
LNKLRDRDEALMPLDVDYTHMIDAELMGYCRSFQILAAFTLPAGMMADSASPRGGELLLKRAFQERMDHRLERIFRLLALLYHPRDIYNAFVGLTSERSQLQANALEMLEHILKPHLYRRLANVLDPEIELSKKMEFARQVCRTDVKTRTEALRILLHSEDRWLRACALYAAGGSGMRELTSDIDGQSCEGDALLEETRNWALAKMASGHPA